MDDEDDMATGDGPLTAAVPAASGSQDGLPTVIMDLCARSESANCMFVSASSAR